MKRKYVVTLTDEERCSLRALVSSGKGVARKLTHARILLRTDSHNGGPSWTDAAISAGLDVGTATAERVAAQKGLVIRADTPRGVIELQRFVNGIPLYYATTNIDAADSVGTDECWPGGSTGHGLTGSGVTLGVWDAGGARTSHQEFGGRASNGDGGSSTHWHSTHVARTMIAAGEPYDVMIGGTPVFVFDSRGIGVL